MKPQALAERIEQVYQVEPTMGLQIVRDLVLDTYALVESMYPDLRQDVTQARTKFLRWRKQLSQAPVWPSVGKAEG